MWPTWAALRSVVAGSRAAATNSSPYAVCLIHLGSDIGLEKRCIHPACDKATRLNPCIHTYSSTPRVALSQGGGRLVPLLETPPPPATRQHEVLEYYRDCCSSKPSLHTHPPPPHATRQHDHMRPCRRGGVCVLKLVATP